MSTLSLSPGRRSWLGLLITALWLSRAAATAAWHDPATSELITLAAAGALAESGSVAGSRRDSNAPNARIDLDGKLEIRGIRFEPLVAGRNVVHFEVQNRRD